MPFRIINRDITTVCCDAIVNPTDPLFSGKGGTDLAIHTAAGPQLDAECCTLDELGVGEIAVTDGYDLPCEYIFHTVGPVWRGGRYNEAVLLRSCYVNALFKAAKLGVGSIAFPLISSGTFGFPKDKVLRIAIDAISDYLLNSDVEMDITVCVRRRNAFVLSKEIALSEYLDRNGAGRFMLEGHELRMNMKEVAPVDYDEELNCLSCEAETAVGAAPMPKCSVCAAEDLSEWIKHQDDTFAVMLLKLIDKKGMTDVQCYKKANVTKSTFWKINNDAKYRPSKATVLAFAIALELTLEETEQLLKTVGLSLSHSNLSDMIIEFYILNGNYDIFEINAALYKYDQACLGC